MAEEAQHEPFIRNQAPTASEQPLAVAARQEAALDRGIGVVPSRLAILSVGFVLSALALVLFRLLARDVYEGTAAPIDRSASYFLHGYSTPLLDAVMWTATFVGSATFVVPFGLLVVGLLLWRGYRREAVFLVVATVGGVLLNQVLKLAFARERPSLPWSPPIGEYSFPSGHSMNSFVFFLGIASVVWVVAGRRWGRWAFLLAVPLVLLTGTSRVYLGFHYFSDVVGGYVAGLFWLVVAATAIEGGRSAFVVRRQRGDR